MRFNIHLGNHCKFDHFETIYGKTKVRNGFLRSKLVIFDLLHAFLREIVRKLWQVNFSRWRPAAILNSEKRDHLRREHLSDFESPWSKLPISSENTSASKNGYGTYSQLQEYSRFSLHLLEFGLWIAYLHCMNVSFTPFLVAD